MERNPTLSLVTDEQADEDLKQIYEMCQQAMGGVPHLARVIANCKDLLGPFLGLAGAVAQEYTVPMRLKQLAVLRTAELNGCAYCRSIHVPKGEQLGLDSDKMEGVAQKDIPDDVFSAEEKIVIRMTDEMTGRVGAEKDTVAQAREMFGEAGAVELMMTISFYNLMTRLAETSQVPLEG